MIGKAQIDANLAPKFIRIFQTTKSIILDYQVDIHLLKFIPTVTDNIITYSKVLNFKESIYVSS